MPEGGWVVLAAIIAAVPGIYALLIQRRKGKADVADMYQDIAGQAATDLKNALEETKRQREEIKGLTARITILEREKMDWECEKAKLVQQNLDLQKEVQKLREQIEELQKLQGIKPEGV